MKNQMNKQCCPDKNKKKGLCKCKCHQEEPKGIDYTKDNIYDGIGRPDLKPQSPQGVSEEWMPFGEAKEGEGWRNRLGKKMEETGGCKDGKHRGTENLCADWDKEEWGGWKIVSDMLDRPDPNGIYPTSECYRKLYEFVIEQKNKAIETQRTELLKIIENIDEPGIQIVEGETLNSYRGKLKARLLEDFKTKLQ